jgi:probable F420-dependent oxidoreductase
MAQRRFRFGMIDESSQTRERLIRSAQQAERLGYSTFLIRDHFIQGDFLHQLAPIATLATVAVVTTTLRIGTLVFDNDYRHPALLAKETATLDLLSGGRLELGLGAGWLREEYGQTGIPFEAPGVRIERMREAIHVLKGLFAGSPFSFQGKHYQISNLDSFPKPVQHPHPPLLIGAGGKRMLTIAAQEANIIGILASALPNGVLENIPTDRLASSVAEKVALIRQAAGARFEQIELSIVPTVVITNDQQQAAEQIIAKQGWNGIGVEQVLEMPSYLIGSVEQIIEKLTLLRERFALSYFIISDASMEAFAPVVAALAAR